MKNRTLLVDSSYLLKKSFFGARELHTNKFGGIGGLYSFLTTLRKLIRENMINKVVLVWDGENGGVHRHLIDPSYKANRKNKSWYEKIELNERELKKEKEKEESILKQRKRIQGYAEELFLRQIEVDDIEADDIIAEYCIRYNNKEEIILYTNDRDFSQLLNLNIKIIFGNIDDIIDKTNYFFKFKYHYSNALTFKIICGDVSDNIRGVSGVQEKTLIKHIPEIQYRHVSVREVCKRVDEINKQRIEENKKPLKALQNILDSVDRFKLNYKLMNLAEPMLNQQAIDEIEQLDLPLSPEGRSSKNLLKMMNEDQFLSVSNINFVNYVEPFHSVIMNEKQILTEYHKKNR